MFYKDLLKKSSETLKNSKIPNPISEARLILRYILNIQDYEMIDLLNKKVPDETRNKFLDLTNKRAQNYPFAYISNNKEFFGLDFFVNEDVLIPRADSEIIIESIIKDFKNQKNLNILDLGCGSGCLGISAAKNLDSKNLTLADISKKALNIAKTNAKKSKINCEVKFIESDWFQNIPKQEFDIIICNPPYISREDLAIDVSTKYEPELALYAEDKGLENYKKISTILTQYMKKNGKTYFEIGYNQFEVCKDIFKKLDLKVSYQMDYARIRRCIIVSK